MPYYVVNSWIKFFSQRDLTFWTTHVFLYTIPNNRIFTNFWDTPKHAFYRIWSANHWSFTGSRHTKEFHYVRVYGVKLFVLNFHGGALFHAMKLIQNTGAHYKMFTAKYDVYSIYRPFTGTRKIIRIESVYVLSMSDTCSKCFFTCGILFKFTKFMNISWCV